MTDVFIKKKSRDTERRQPSGNRGRGGNYAATSQATSGVPEAGTGKEGSSLEALEGAWPS